MTDTPSLSQTPGASVCAAGPVGPVPSLARDEGVVGRLVVVLVSDDAVLSSLQAALMSAVAVTSASVNRRRALGIDMAESLPNRPVERRHGADRGRYTGDDGAMEIVAEPTRRDPPVAVVVVAGGSARRMGADKPLLRVEGRTLAGRAAALAEGAGAVVVRPASMPPIPDLDHRCVAVVGDEPANSGPAAAAAHGLARLVAASPGTPPGAFVAVLAGDLAVFGGATLAAMRAHLSARPGLEGVVASEGARPHWLCSMWRIDSLVSQPPPGAGASMRSWFEGLAWDAVDALVGDVDTPDDAHRLGVRSGEPIRLLCLNVRSSFARDGDDRWSLRGAALARFVVGCEPEIVALQEATARQRSDLGAAFAPGGRRVVVLGEPRRRVAGEAVPVVADSERWVVIRSETRWFGSRPQRSGSRASGASRPRIATAVRLVRPGTAVPHDVEALLVVNTHLDHASASARASAARQLASWIAEWRRGPDGSDLPVALAGDLNAAASERDVFAPLEAAGLRRVVPHADPPTFRGFRGTASGAAIDHVMVSAELDATATVVAAEEASGSRRLSDHDGILVEIGRAAPVPYEP